MSVAASTREAARAHPFLVRALRAGIVNYRAAARFLGIDDADTGAAALRRYAEDLPPLDVEDEEWTIRMERGVGPVDDPGEAFVTVDGTHFGGDEGDWTAVIGRGAADAEAVSALFGRLALADVTPVAAGMEERRIIVVCARTQASTVLRCFEGEVPS